MNRDDMTSDGIDVIEEMVSDTSKKLNDRSLHALERAPINDGIQYIRGLQHKSGGFSLMDIKPILETELTNSSLHLYL